MKFIAGFIVLALIIQQCVTVWSVGRPFGDKQLAADIWNVTPENINSYKEWW